MKRSTVLLLILFAATAGAQDFDTRCADLRADALSTPDFNPTGIAPIQAFEGDTIPQSSLDELMKDLITDSKADFRIVQLIRIMFLDPSYQAQIVPAIKDIPFWLQPGEDFRVYWSENHHIMWMSSAWLLKEINVNVGDPTLKERLVHYLEMKIQYGYYEFFSSLYLPYTLSGLLNLIDFCQDDTIRSLAEQAAKKLIQEVLWIVNSEGVFFPAAGRNFASSYLEPYDGNFNSIVWLLTGLGVRPTRVYHVGAFLTTSKIDVGTITWQPEHNAVVNIGHPITQNVNGVLSSRVDKVLAQWSFGGYFHPDVIDDTQWLLEEYDLQDHKEFSQFNALTSIPADVVGLGISLFDLEQITESSVLCNEQVAIFRHGPTALSSVQEYWAGNLGYQQVPWMAAIGRVGVWTQSGVSGSVEEWGQGVTNNSHLPYVKQTDNVALIMYKPEQTYQWALEIAGIDNFDVSLYWPSSGDNSFIHTEQQDAWYLGQQWGGYIAVRSHCGSTICGDDKQTWAVVVGNAEMYGNWNGFVTAIKGSTYVQEMRGGWFSRRRYYGKITVDTPKGDVTIEHEWY